MSESVTGQDLLHWAETLAGIARTGLGFTESLYEKERYEEILKVAAEIRGVVDAEIVPEAVVDEWMRAVGQGVAGYVTPKAAVGAIVGNDENEILLVQRADSGVWLYPTGWADIGYSPVEIAIKEVYEETGIHCEPVTLVSIVDGMRQGFTRIPLYSMVFHCKAVGGQLRSHPLETTGCGWFARDSLPEPLAGLETWVEDAFAAIEGRLASVRFDSPRSMPWQEEPQ
ncbi:MAG: NUDIX hydrolase N-terminal domain-containing protein [Actinomycetota bacterium]|jgi:ADP-ribose pyrophosphatase YjhB (NUDIX family)|nr:hydrolase [Acidimicrobiaceae bacterium]MEC7914739.1 NUDIX hydrolase N-terminal domain-containing protein [Actinomycetota bacterium]MEC9474014.1 NUDIX hydrolase N-terminal domain-containing protein [Actinomycetota bacterium]MED5361492.1 NUDIX hydrolase N-terminal domain-containing protein [Actinomycetota bacterium]